MLHVALYQPIIPQNVGNIARTCVGMDAHLHIIGPTIIDLSDKAVKRAGLDYWDDLTLTEHANPEAFFAWAEQQKGNPTTSRDREGADPGVEENESVGPLPDGRGSLMARPTAPGAMYAVTKFATRRFDTPPYRDGDILLFGSEREGLPPDIHARFDDEHRIAIPIPGAVRSYNLGNSVAIVLAAAMSKAGLWPGEWAPKEGHIGENTF
ncbi:MAG: tRNA (cytidine(34)-2'-O)-methyltransferase [Planctomycetota bacterium]